MAVLAGFTATLVYGGWMTINGELQVGAYSVLVFLTHRLSTVRQADAIHLLEQGQIIESGTHDELLAQNGPYAALWRLQTGES